MQTVYYSFMPRLLAFLLLLAAVPSSSQDAKPPAATTPAAKSSRAPFSDSHEGIIIGVDPWTTASRYKDKFAKTKSPFSRGIVALQVSLHNDNPKGVRVSLQRIRLIVQIDEDNRQELQPLSPDDVADTVLLKPETKDPTARRLPLPVPVPVTKSNTRDANWTKLRDACQDAAVPSSVIGANETVEGLLYFDLRGEIDLLHSSRLYVPNLVTMDTNDPISYFEIELGHAKSDSQ
jgi:protein-tyrosine-phosphatase